MTRLNLDGFTPDTVPSKLLKISCRFKLTLRPADRYPRDYYKSAVIFLNRSPRGETTTLFFAKLSAISFCGPSTMMFDANNLRASALFA